MANDYHYPGEELQLFEEARHWKTYLSKKIKPFIKGEVLEVGAGISETTHYLVNENVQSWICLEPDEQLQSISQEKINKGSLPSVCKAKKGTLDDLGTDEKFDTIVYIDVLEHIEDDRSELIKALSHLKQNGHLIILSPAFQFLYSPFDKAIGHYRRYNKNSLRKVIPATLSEKKLFYLESTGMLLLLLNKFIFRRNYPSGRHVKIWDRIFIPVSRLLDRIIFYSFGKTIIGVWQKSS